MDSQILDGKVVPVVLMLVAVGFGAAGLNADNPLNNEAPVKASDSAEGMTDQFNYVDVVKVYKNGELALTTHNALMEGEAIVRSLSTGNHSANYSTIALGNGNEPLDSSASLDSEFSANGLGPQTATLDYIAGSDENEWNLTATFTSQTTATVNTTAVKANTAQPNNLDYYAGASFGRNLNVVSGDEISVEWSFSVQ